MKRSTLIALLAAVMVMAGSVFSFAADGLTLVSSYPEDGQTNTSMENLGVKLTFSNPINSDEARKIDESKFSIVDEEGEKVPVKVLFSDKNDGLVLVVADVDEGFIAKNNCEYTDDRCRSCGQRWKRTCQGTDCKLQDIQPESQQHGQHGYDVHHVRRYHVPDYAPEQAEGRRSPG